MDAEEESKVNNRNFKVFQPGLDKLEDGETLEYDSRFYEMYHSLNVEWPCLSFDIIPDKLGSQRKRVRIR
jgi:ribosome assembly protein RRB1